MRNTRQFLVPCLAALLVQLPQLARGEEKVPRIDSIGKLKPGGTGLLETTEAALKMRYFLRVPKSYDVRRGARLIVFLHGSNMNGLDYLRSFEAKGWCADDILLCPNGEQGQDPFGQNNFTFDSARLVAQILKEAKAALKTTVTYVGGHSQGAFLTYSLILQYPELCQGAFPMAGDCWLQNEPNLWETNPEMLARQKRLAIAVIHGKQDPVVNFSQGLHARDVFLAAGYPRVRLFAPEALGHQFMLAPVPEALEWLDGFFSPDWNVRARALGRWVREKELGWAVSSAREILQAPKASSSARNEAKAALKAAEAAAKKEVPAMAQARAKTPPEEWIPRWIEVRRLHGETDAAKALVEEYEADRAKQRAEGTRLFREASALLRANEKEKGREKLRELLRVAPATYEAHYAVSWLKDGA